jgi:hypothetical protein
MTTLILEEVRHGLTGHPYHWINSDGYVVFRLCIL